jgi:hypothetical protein
MNRILLSTVVIGAALSATVAQASLNFAAIAGTVNNPNSGSSIEFFGTASQFAITDSTTTDASLGGTGLAQWQASDGLYGRFNGGPWSYGPITGGPNGPVQTAMVTTSTGSIAIDDGAGFVLTGNINWVQVSTLFAAGSLNAAATVNISGLAYGGVNNDLSALVLSGGLGSVNLTFQFEPGLNLTQLTTDSAPSTPTTYETSYSGSIVGVPVPEPTTMIAGALLLLPFAASTLRIFRKSRTA